ncbi:ABC transporter substrate-binding protein [Streptomyces sp. IBSNAI002]|uniref:ABC transporter substrate-binding protein n=1 Tax=Streptomyces sp. IBSNAI002 TaxID=3457500 RepID=UPI003FD1C5ED
MRRFTLPLPLLAAVAAVSVVATTASCQNTRGAAGPGSGPVRVKVAHVPSTLFAPLYVADAKGYFKEEGIEVELSQVKTGQDAVPLAASGKVDAVAAGFSAGLFNGMAKGLDVKVAASMGVSTGATPSPTTLEVRGALAESGEVTRPEDLRGRKVAVAGGAGAAGGYQLDATLHQAGLSVKDVTVVNVAFPDMKTALASGGADAAMVPAPFSTAMEQDGTARQLAVPPRGTTASGLVFGGAFDGKPAARAFLTALRKAAADLQGAGAGSEEHLDILAKATGQKVDVLRATPAYGWDPALAPDRDQLAAQQRTYHGAGLMEGDPLPADRLIAAASGAGEQG